MAPGGGEVTREELREAIDDRNARIALLEKSLLQVIRHPTATIAVLDIATAGLAGKDIPPFTPEKS